MPEDIAIQELITQIEATAAYHQLPISSINVAEFEYSNNPISGTDMLELPLTITVSGDYIQLKDFISNILNLPRFTNRKFENRSLFEILRKHYQIQVTGGEQKIMAIHADEKIQHHFRVKRNHPILRVDRKMETNRVGLTFYSQIYCNTVDYSLIGRF